ncbi:MULTISPECIES: aromatic ring-hydroxylating dioxygenase subunit alpha [unclassified Variovorax]|uniref:aromatic ring-hydroxylating dioxygenase subunit alpha n=1 Tax=unclassified Variovorax TaxID=663243 RepID=UPI00076CBBC0|nr:MULTISPECIES: aromatic ring-hydroxylating dioxygenase subunit alpha [unclassified Variovorax]KWT83522.1 Ortho-halobenzoate 1,2-dioxygenase alpha-ISP protein OhbB [Variovorax sp. WDL1]PNG59625.1 Terephthalate 1,2-dioxygenase, terminal oxygenase component subunit alpha 1 [Variovorax sp. B4]PNG60584.1 Terephthalate 1,2-dioxygenase, terminal oxygenase component subunit alpha 1 [Variovorax sp. B2]VTV13525.1 Terephthalate 1,2-dioxygenase, terminal oxygenase component subunit alpha 1 [Variovorax sp
MNHSAPQPIHWAGPGLTRIPFALYSDARTAADEQARIFRGEVWNFLCLEAELPDSGSYRTTFAGETPVVVVRDEDGEIYAFENRCAHRGALIALEKSGRAENFQCVYHAWSYSRQGDLTGVAFEKGVKGQGGMPSDFCKETHGPRKLRIATFCGLVFGSFSEDVPAIEDYLGEEICARIERVLHKPVEVIGRFTQALPNNWKLYVENVKDSYHASLLHLFFTTFELNRLSQKGGVIVDESGGHHVSYSMIDPAAEKDASYKEQALRSDNDRYRLKDPSLLAGFKEYEDGVTLQILSVFPGFVLQQIQNCLAVRQVLPKGVERTELNWTYLGYADDTPEQRRVRLKQSNLIGPAGFISMEDGAVGGFVQRGIAGARDLEAVVEMGGGSTESSEGRATEASVRGFWKAYRHHMGA